MEHNLQETIALLSRTPASLKTLLIGLPDIWIHRNEGEGTWDVYSVIGHLIHGERTDWMPRAKRIIQHGQTKAFDPFDRLAQDRESLGKSLQDLLEEFSRLRAQNLAELLGRRAHMRVIGDLDDDLVDGCPAKQSNLTRLKGYENNIVLVVPKPTALAGQNSDDREEHVPDADHLSQR